MSNRNAYQVLVLDDDAGTCERLEEMFRDNGFDCQTILSMDQLAPGCYDVLLLDLHLPDWDGLDTLTEAIRRIGTEIPIIIFTGTQPYDVGAEAIRLGAADFVSKNSWVDADILAKVEGTVQRHRKVCSLQNRIQEETGSFPALKPGDPPPP